VPSSWKTFGRAVEIVTIVLLVLAVSYLWINSDSEDAEAPQVLSQAPEAKAEAVPQPYRPTVPMAPETAAYQQPVAVSPTIDNSPPADLYQPPKEPAPIYSSAGQIRLCDVPYQFETDWQAAQTTPSEFVEQVIRGIQAVLRSKQNIHDENSAELFDVFYDNLLPYFDTKTAAQQVLAKHWRAATDDQRTRFICAFQIVLIKRWTAGSLELYQHELAVLPFSGDATKRTTTVKTNRQLVDGTNISVNYTLRKYENSWLMFDVTVEGVSYIRNFRAELDAEIRNSSLEEVIRQLEKEAEIILGG
jgi:phospholipid transport system substrate-binding protein